MGKVTYAPGIQYVNGSLAKPKKVDGHKCGDYLIGTHRTAETTNPDCTRLYIRKADVYTRKSALSQDEKANQSSRHQFWLRRWGRGCQRLYLAWTVQRWS